MIAGYYSIQTVGEDYDKGRLRLFKGVKYDHRAGRTLDEIKLVLEADTFSTLAGEHLREHQAAECIKAWLSDDCYYFSLSPDRTKHYLRAMFYYAYLDPYDHERSGNHSKQVNFMDVMRLNHFLGEDTLEMPVTPLGEINSYTPALIERAATQDVLGFMAAQIHRTIQRGASAFRLLLSHQEKRDLLNANRPLVHLTRVPDDLALRPKVILPFASSQTNRNRYYVYDLQSSVRSSYKSLGKLIEGLERGARGVTANLQHGGAYRLDANRSSLLAPLESIPKKLLQSYFDEGFIAAKASHKLKIADLNRASHAIAQYESSQAHSGPETTFYAVELSRKRKRLSHRIRAALLNGDIPQAVAHIMGHPQPGDEFIRLSQFLRRNHMDESEYISEIDACMTE